MSERYLRVRYTPKTNLVNRVGSMLGLTEAANTHTPEDSSVLVKRSFWWTKHLRLGEVGRVARALEGLAAQTSDGTDIHYRNWTIEDVKVRKDGSVHVTHLPKLFFGWEHAVNRAHKRHVRKARKELLKKTHTTRIDSIKGINPLRQALKTDKREQKALQRVDPDSRIHGWMGWRARFVGALAEGNPVRIARSWFLNPGMSRTTIRSQLEGMMLRMADAQIDPHDAIHGPFEPQVKALKKLQSGTRGALLTGLFGELPLVNNVIDRMIVGNKLLSRDTRRGLSLRDITSTARSVYVISRYAKLYEGKAKVRGVKGWISRTLLYPPSSLAEGAADRRMQRGLAAQLAKTETILNVQPGNLKNIMIQQFQRIVAEEFQYAYRTPGVAVELLSHKMLEQARQVANVADTLRSQIVANTVNRIPNRIRRMLRISEQAFAPKQQGNQRQLVTEAVQAYGGKPQSMKAQVDAILAYADKVISSGALTPDEVEAWKIAKLYAQRYQLLDSRAQELSNISADQNMSQVAA